MTTIISKQSIKRIRNIIPPLLSQFPDCRTVRFLAVYLQWLWNNSEPWMDFRILSGDGAAKTMTCQIGKRPISDFVGAKLRLCWLIAIPFHLDWSMSAITLQDIQWTLHDTQCWVIARKRRIQDGKYKLIFISKSFIAFFSHSTIFLRGYVEIDWFFFPPIIRSNTVWNSYFVCLCLISGTRN